MQEKHQQLSRIIMFTGLFLSLFFCQQLHAQAAANTKHPDLAELDWLIGHWEFDAGRRVYHETWTKVGQNKLTGVGYAIAGTDTISSEKLEIVFEDGQINYVATVPHNPGPVRFRLLDTGGPRWVFENPEHDFPQRITYLKKNAGYLQASIEGVNDGKKSGFTYYFAKIE